MVMRIAAGLLFLACIAAVAGACARVFTGDMGLGSAVAAILPSLLMGLISAMYVLGRQPADKVDVTDSAVNGDAIFEKHYGPIPSDPSLTLFMEPDPQSKDPIYAMLLSLGLLLGGWALYLAAGYPVSNNAMLAGMAIVLPVLIVHELIHRQTLPKEVRANAGLGIDVKQIAIGVLWAGQVSRGRMILIQLTPALILSVIPLALSFLPAFDSEIFRAYVVAHTAACAGDFMGVAKVLRKTPAKSGIHVWGNRVFWGPLES